ncbi:MAG: DUF5671 domain-containing protein [Patescibacteria group bacterium]
MEAAIKRGTPKDVFLHLLAVVTLYVSVVAFIALWWQYVSFIFPDALKFQDYYGGYSSFVYDGIRLAMAALIIVFPIHILISWLIGREFKVDQGKREIRVRKWLWYITLFVSAVTIIIDLIILVNNFLKGELSTQFLLNTLVVLVVAAAVFGYYLWDLRHREKVSSKPKLFAWITSGVIIASIIYGFFLIGLPSSQRARRFDEQRVNSLSLLQNEIIAYWQQKEKLPTSLNDLRSQISGFIPPTDPETLQPYEYQVTGALSFNLCAVFKTYSSYSGGGMTRMMPVTYYSYQQNWEHGSGRVCFERTIDPQMYKINNISDPVPLKY